MDAETRTSLVTLTAADGHRLRAYCASPGEAILDRSLVLLHEIFGINLYMRQMAQIFAQHGFTAIVPDLFARLETDVELNYDPDDLAHAIRLRDRLDWTRVRIDIDASVRYLRGAAINRNGKVGALGYCLGGGLAVLAAAKNAVDAAVSYYGVGVQDRLHFASEITVPLLFHFAENDDYCPAEARRAIGEAFAAHDNVHSFLYPGVGHAFATYGRGTFEPVATDLAFQRTVAHLDRWITS